VVEAEEAGRRQEAEMEQAKQRDVLKQRRELEDQQRSEEERVRREALEAEEEPKRIAAEQAQREIDRRRRALADAERRAKDQAEQAEGAERRRHSDEAEAADDKRRALQEAEELRRERADAEARQQAEQPEQDRGPDSFIQTLMALRKRYKDSDPAGLATCLQTMRSYINNIVVNPVEPKFHRINCDNNAFRSRVAAFDGATAVLEALGFTPDGTTLLVTGPWVSANKKKLWEAQNKVDVILEQVKSAL